MSFLAQPHFEGCEGARDAEPSLCYDDRDSTEMREPEPKGIDPSPPAKAADDDEDEAADNERDYRNVQCKHEVRKQLIRGFVTHSRCLLSIWFPYKPNYWVIKYS